MKYALRHLRVWAWGCSFHLPPSLPSFRGNLCTLPVLSVRARVPSPVRMPPASSNVCRRFFLCGAACNRQHLCPVGPGPRCLSPSIHPIAGWARDALAPMLRMVCVIGGGGGGRRAPDNPTRVLKMWRNPPGPFSPPSYVLANASDFDLPRPDTLEDALEFGWCFDFTPSSLASILGMHDCCSW